ncbi:MAG: pyridine nucleotide-disulfide oxidoreductase [Pseudomonadaceae bacterium]|nr:MAG: pyridine nucleotide-disulfide oxidoreductase [Pseudomonadaceae bacterium]
MTETQLVKSPFIMSGAGHSNLLVLRQWLEQGYTPPTGSILVSPDPAAWYSGMLPGLIAGRFNLADCSLPLDPLCTRLNLRLLESDITAFTADTKTLTLASGLQLQGDIISFNVGSQPAPIATDNSLPLIPVKPFPVFIKQWQHWRQDSTPQHISIIGGGAAAFEIALALATSLPQCSVNLLCAGSLLAGHPNNLVRRARSWLHQQRIGLREHCRISHIAAKQLWRGDQSLGSSEAIILATGASAHPWQANSGLTTDQRGFISIDQQLRSTSHPQVFASGDCASLTGTKKSGVYAVRQGPILAHNLRALLQGAELRHYQPQEQTLALLATGDGGALMSYGRWSAGGKLFGLWKDHLDLGFMRRQRIDHHT